MTLLYILFAFWALFVMLDFKKAVLCYAPFKMLFYYDVRLTASLPFDMAIMLLIAICFYFKRFKYSSIPFPFKKGYIVYGIIYSIGCIIPVFMANKIPATIISILLYSYIYYQCLKSMRDVRIAAITYMLFSIFLVANGIYELMTESCPVADWINSMPYIDKEHAWDTNFEFLRFGLPRIKSFMPFSISYGVACTIMFAIPYCLMFSGLKDRPVIRLSIITMCFLLVGIVTAGSRTPILGLLVLAAYLIWDKETLRKHKKKIIVSCILIGVFMWPYIYANILSIIDPKMAEEVSGSSIEMRNGQYAIAWNYMMQSPIIGLGKNTEITDVEFFGGESVWLPLMINNGIVGIFGYVYFYCSIVKSTKSPNSKFLHIVTASWLLIRTATSLMGIGDATYLTIYMLLYRYFYLKNKLC